jgi:hypothetical protein
MKKHKIAFSRVNVPKPLFVALILISVISAAVAFAVVMQWPLDITMRVGGTDFTVHELDGSLTRIDEAHEHDFGVLAEYDPASWFIEIENLSPYSIWVNHTITGFPANFTVELMYDYEGFDAPFEWTEGMLLELQSTGVNQSVIVRITVCNQGADAGFYTFQIVIQAA